MTPLNKSTIPRLRSSVWSVLKIIYICPQGSESTPLTPSTKPMSEDKGIYPNVSKLVESKSSI